MSYHMLHVFKVPAHVDLQLILSRPHKGKNLATNRPFNIMSWNVWDLNSPVKRTKCLEFFKRKGILITLVQETHLKTNDIHRFQNRFYKCVTYSSAANRSKGVAILFDRKLCVNIDNSGKDDVGRFTYVCITIDNIKICLASIYGPNIHDPNFFTMISNKLLDMPDYQFIIWGDFNQVCDVTLDKSTTGPPNQKPPSSINSFISDLSLIDPWRLCNQTANNYTFFSARHKTYSRIDYIFVSPHLNQWINSTDILPIIISDHAPVMYNFQIQQSSHKCTHRWRFNTTLLQNSTFLKCLKNNLKMFLEINSESASSPQILWETTTVFSGL